MSMSGHQLEIETLPLVSHSRHRHDRTSDPGSDRHAHKHVPTARWYHAVFHTITAVVGAGVLGLPYAIASLGLAGGLIALTVACIVSLYCSYLLASLHQINGKRYNSYRELGEGILGPLWGFWAVVPFQFSVMVGLAVAYMVAAGESLQNIYSSSCSSDSCPHVPFSAWMLLFAAAEILLSQLPDLHSLWWVSLIGGAMSLGYSSIAFVAAAHIAHTSSRTSRRRLIGMAGPGSIHSSSSSLASAGSAWQSKHLWLAGATGLRAGGRALAAASDGAAALAAPPGPLAAAAAAASSIYEVFNALGMVSFAYGGQLVQLEIQATLAPSPSPKREMMKALLVSYALVVVAYYGVGCAGYAAFGAGVDADVLLSFRGMPFWVDVADLMVVVHVAASWQVFSMPVFEAIEDALYAKGWQIRNSEKLTKIVSRSAYVLGCWLIASRVPFFGELMGVIGAVGFTPMSFILPSLLWIVHHKHKFTGDWWLNVGIIVCFTTVGMLAAIAAMHNLVT